MKKLLQKVNPLSAVIGTLSTLLIFSTANFSLALGPSYPVQGRVNLDGAAANGAIVTITDVNTGATSTDTVGPTGNSGTTGWYLINLNNLNVAPTNGDTINISASINGLVGTSSFTYSSATNFKLANTINITTPTPTTFTINSGAGANGNISPSGTTTVASGATQSFAIVPDAGFDVSGLVVDGLSVGTTTNYIFNNVQANHTIAASFATGTTPTFTIIASSGANGTISQLGTTTFTAGSSTVYAITPNGGFQVQNVLVDGASIGATTSVAFNNIATNHTISVSFQASSVLTKINVAPTNLSLVTGSQQQYAATALDQFNSPMATTFIWSSTNTGVATIDINGLVTATGAGTTTIMASSSGVIGSTTLTVMTAPILTSIGVTPTSSTVYLGGSQQFTAAPIDQFGQPFATTTIWSSSNPAIGTISSSTGLFTPVATGTAIITASSSTMVGTTSVTVAADITPPTTPTNLAVTVNSGTQITFSWTPSTDNARVAGHNIYRNGTTTILATTTLNSFVDTGLTPNTNYTYTVTAFDPTGNTSAFPTSVSATTQATGSGGGGNSFPGVYIPEKQDAVDVELELSPTQTGHAEYKLEDNLHLALDIPSGAITEHASFNAKTLNINSSTGQMIMPDNSFMVGNSFFQITATNNTGQEVHSFAKDLTIKLALALPTSTTNLGVYYYDTTNKQWVLVPGAVFDSAASTVTFKTNHLTTFAVLKVPGLISTVKANSIATAPSPTKPEIQKTVLGVKIYPNGTLIKDKNGKIYTIKNGKRIAITNLAELKKYKNQKTYQANDDTLKAHPVAMQLNNGTLIRDKDKKVYVIVNQKKVQLKTAAQLKKYKGQKIIDVDNNTRDAY